MRKLVILTIILLGLSACNNIISSKSSSNDSTDSANYIGSDSAIKVQGIIYSTNFTYKGHDMVLFRWNSTDGTIVHSPECRKCFPKYE